MSHFLIIFPNFHLRVCVTLRLCSFLYLLCFCRSSIVFKTAGVLLDEMRDKGMHALDYKVIVLDEVHERSVESDLVLVCVKQFMLRNNNLRSTSTCLFLIWMFELFLHLGLFYTWLFLLTFSRNSTIMYSICKYNFLGHSLHENLMDL